MCRIHTAVCRQGCFMWLCGISGLDNKPAEECSCSSYKSYVICFWTVCERCSSRVDLTHSGEMFSPRHLQSWGSAKALGALVRVPIGLTFKLYLPCFRKKSTLAVTNYRMNLFSAHKLDAILQKCENLFRHRFNVRDLWFPCPIIQNYVFTNALLQEVKSWKRLQSVTNVMMHVQEASKKNCPNRKIHFAVGTKPMLNGKAINSLWHAIA